MSVKEHSGIDAEQMLNVLTDLHVTFRETLTPEEQDALWRRDEAKVEGLAGAIALNEQLADAEFDLGAVAVAAEQLANEIGEVLARRERELYADCLDAFYAAEELSRDPAHAELIPRVEEMRKAHLESYGKPVPPLHTDNDAFDGREVVRRGLSPIWESRFVSSSSTTRPGRGWRAFR